MRKRWHALALPLVLQLAFANVAYAEETAATVDQTVEASTQRGVRVAGVEVPKITNPRVLVSFNLDPDLVALSTEQFQAGANPDDPACGADHEPLQSGTVNMTIVADLQFGATGSRDVLVQYTETHAGSVVHTHDAHNSSEAIGPVPPTGQTERIPLCIYND